MQNDKCASLFSTMARRGKQSADWSELERRAGVFFSRNLSPDRTSLQGAGEFDIIIAMRERTKFPKELSERLPSCA